MDQHVMELSMHVPATRAKTVAHAPKDQVAHLHVNAQLIIQEPLAQSNRKVIGKNTKLMRLNML